MRTTFGGNKRSHDRLVGILAWFIVGAMAIMMLAGCVGFGCVLALCVWHFLDGGWLLLAMFGGIALLGAVCEWAFKRVMKSNNSSTGKETA